jgi:hypothetical protein
MYDFTGGDHQDIKPAEYKVNQLVEVVGIVHWPEE